MGVRIITMIIMYTLQCVHQCRVCCIAVFAAAERPGGGARELAGPGQWLSAHGTQVGCVGGTL